MLPPPFSNFFSEKKTEIAAILFTSLGTMIPMYVPSTSSHKGLPLQKEVAFNPAHTTGRLLHLVLKERFFRLFTQQGPGQSLD